MPPSLESTIKSKFAKVFVRNDWKIFKSTAEFYFRRSATLKRSDIGIVGKNGLLLRNIQKRLFLGIGGELIIKAFFLREGYMINRQTAVKGKLHALGSIDNGAIEADETLNFNALIDDLHNVTTFENYQEIKKALLILKVFRNKEGHVVTRQHIYDASLYRDIELGLVELYRQGFKQTLSITISMERHEKGRFIVR